MAATVPARHPLLRSDKAAASNREQNPASKSATAASRASAHRSPAAESLLRTSRQRPPSTVRPISHSSPAEFPELARQKVGPREKWLFPETSSEVVRSWPHGRLFDVSAYASPFSLALRVHLALATMSSMAWSSSEPPKRQPVSPLAAARIVVIMDAEGNVIHIPYRSTAHIQERNSR